MFGKAEANPTAKIEKRKKLCEKRFVFSNETQETKKTFMISIKKIANFRAISRIFYALRPESLQKSNYRISIIEFL